MKLPAMTDWRRRIAILAGAAALTLTLAGTAEAATFTVTTSFDGDDGSCTAASCTLHEAIDAANAAPGDDTINFEPDVTVLIDLTMPLPAIAGGGSIVGPGANVLNVRRSNAAPLFRIFKTTGNGAVSISGLKISNGRVAQDFTSDRIAWGGGIWMPFGSDRNGSLTLDRVIVTGNHAVADPPGPGFGSGVAYGGGVAVEGGELTIRNSEISGNSATASSTSNLPNTEARALGGGVSLFLGDLTVDNSTIRDNIVRATSSTVPEFAAGGGIDAGTLGGSITNSTISGNAAGDGVGSSPGGGGGISNVGSAGRTLAITNTTLSGNHADDFGGAIDNFGQATTSLNAVTIANNVANEDGDGFGDGGGTQSGGPPPAGINVTNTLYYGNLASGPPSGDQCSGFDHVSGGYNLRAPGGCGGFNGPGEVVNTNFPLGPLAPNGGPTLTHALPAGSPPVNAGNPATPGSGPGACPATDQRGFYRGGVAGRCDIGAFELGATVAPPPPPPPPPGPDPDPTPEPVTDPPTQPPPTPGPTPTKKKCKKKGSKKSAGAAGRKKCKKGKKK